MVLVCGVIIPEQRIIKSALQSFFYGIGPNVAARLCARLSIHPMAKFSSLNPAKITALDQEMTQMKLDNNLRKEMQDNILRLRDLGTYRGRRHAQGLPVRGQKTKKQVMSARRLNRVERYN